MRDELSMVEAKLRDMLTRIANACVVNGHGDGPLSWEIEESVS